jgi:hypothetical protein
VQERLDQIIDGALCHTGRQLECRRAPRDGGKAQEKPKRRSCIAHRDGKLRGKEPSSRSFDHEIVVHAPDEHAELVEPVPHQRGIFAVRCVVENG